MEDPIFKDKKSSNVEAAKNQIKSHLFVSVASIARFHSAYR